MNASFVYGLTGTPIFKDINDVAVLINLLSSVKCGQSVLPDTMQGFYNTCLNVDEDKRREFLQYFELKQ